MRFAGHHSVYFVYCCAENRFLFNRTVDLDFGDGGHNEYLALYRRMVVFDTSEQEYGLFRTGKHAATHQSADRQRSSLGMLSKLVALCFSAFGNSASHHYVDMEPLAWPAHACHKCADLHGLHHAVVETVASTKHRTIGQNNQYDRYLLFRLDCGSAHARKSDRAWMVHAPYSCVPGSVLCALSQSFDPYPTRDRLCHAE